MSQSVEKKIMPPFKREMFGVNLYQILPSQSFIHTLLEQNDFERCRRGKRTLKKQLKRLEKSYHVTIEQKITTFNWDMCNRFDRLLEKGFWRPGCIEKLRVMLGWLDCPQTCWTRYRHLMQVFRYRLFYLIQFSETWARMKRREDIKCVTMREYELMAMLENTKWVSARKIVWIASEKLHDLPLTEKEDDNEIPQIIDIT